VLGKREEIFGVGMHQRISGWHLSGNDNMGAEEHESIIVTHSLHLTVVFSTMKNYE
jgi:hypothetical protein